MRADDVMVSKVITVTPDTLVEDVACLLLTHRISAMPVVGEQGQLVGIISEGDLIRRPEAGTLRRHSWWLELFTSKRDFAAEYVKSHAHKVADVMTRHVITAAPDTPLDEIAGLLEKHRIKRVPIVDHGRIVGIVSRANLLQALANAKVSMPAVKPSDSEIRKTVIARLSAEPWAPTMLNVTVHDGAVELWGYVNSAEEKKAALIVVEDTPGVTGINDNLLLPPATLGAV